MNLQPLLLFIIVVVAVNCDTETHFTEFYTPDDTVYRYFPVHTQRINFKVKASTDVHVGLFTSPAERIPWYEIVIGGWGNERSVIRSYRDYTQAEAAVVARLDTPEILDPNGYKEFWVTFTGKTILVGNGGEVDAFMKWTEKTFPKIRFIGVHTGFGSTGHWTIHFNDDERDAVDE